MAARAASKANGKAPVRRAAPPPTRQNVARRTEEPARQAAPFRSPARQQATRYSGGRQQSRSVPQQSYRGGGGRGRGGPKQDDDRVTVGFLYTTKYPYLFTGNINTETLAALTGLVDEANDTGQEIWLSLMEPKASKQQNLAFVLKGKVVPPREQTGYRPIENNNGYQDDPDQDFNDDVRDRP